MALYQGIIYFDMKPIKISPNERLHAQTAVFVYYLFLVVLLMYVDAMYQKMLSLF